MAYVLALDPATSTGFATFVLENNEARLLEMGVLPVDNSTEFAGDAMLSLRHQVEGVIDRLPQPPVHCHVETFFFSRKFCNGSDLNFLLRGAIYQLMRERQIPYTLYAPTHWKKFVAGRATPSKADIEEYGKTKAPKEFVKRALEQRYEIQFPSHSYVNGKRCKFRHDVSDAVGIGVFGIASQHANVRFLPHQVTNEATLTLS